MARADNFAEQVGGEDGKLAFQEAVARTTSHKITGPSVKAHRMDRAVGTVSVGDLAILFMDGTGGKIEQFCDIIGDYKLDVNNNMFDNVIYQKCMEQRYKELPEPFRLRKEPTVPHYTQIVILPSTSPQQQASEDKRVRIIKHVYLNKNKIFSKDCMDMCFGQPMKINWGNFSRNGLVAFNYLLDNMRGKQCRHWMVSPKFEKKATSEQAGRDAGYRFIGDRGPRSNNKNQFMEWTDEHINLAGSPIEGWSDGKVQQALLSYMRGRQNAKTLEYWPFTLKSLAGWFFDEVLVRLGHLHAITWIGKTKTGKSLGSKTILFTQSKFEIDAAGRDDLVPSIVAAKHLDFFKAEPITKFKPGVFDDGMLQRMDSSFLKAFLNPGDA